MKGRAFFKKLAIVCQSGQLFFFHEIQGKGKGHIPEPVVVAIALTVGGNVNKLRIGSIFMKVPDQLAGKGSTI
jgi:hypothetical protein